jgi:hypothetical protein
LRSEEHVAQVNGDAIVPVGMGDGIESVAVVAGGIVDEDRDVAHLGAYRFNCGLQRRDIADVALDKHGRIAGFFSNALDQCLTGVLRDVDEGHAGTLLAELLRKGRADAASAASDENGFASEVGVDRPASLQIFGALRHFGEPLLYRFMVAKERSEAEAGAIGEE